ncbi:hypothetical protein CHLRE_03g145607v5 [Chlamydomonas reinhardtii]|uniref:Trafficking protein particle complex subunit n=1 Tax=Chlamydomonas reinhardtii TaxID=3055 RepID=A8J304_CHLRE|nr:uncharacterized protein CHLRE_03g145607v5 [Chlamydomonas reinhardtii]PNW84474.1 hypothetical protein CHLRE_03g145607v5 [Chlamydomonas reinhardtii]|eukprot:XP_001695613.1 component of TRAPP complex [Chlamydomonas reinhardtii]
MLRSGPTGARNAPALEQINAEVFTLTYGSIVRQLISDYEDIEEVNKQLEQMGYNMGIRLVDEFLAKAKISRCSSFRDTADVVAKQALPMFLNVTANVTNWSPDQTECSLVLTDNPLADFVELPDEYRELRYCNVLAGVVRGALEMVNMEVECRWVSDMLRGDDCYELRLKLKEHRDEKFPYKDDD